MGSGSGGDRDRGVGLPPIERPDLPATPGPARTYSPVVAQGHVGNHAIRIQIAAPRP